ARRPPRLHVLDLHAPHRHRAGRRPHARHHGEGPVGPAGGRGELPPPSGVRDPHRGGHGQHARPHGLRDGHAGAAGRVDARRAHRGQPRRRRGVPGGWRPRDAHPGQAGRSDRDRGQSAGGHRGASPGPPRHERRPGPKGDITMTDSTGSTRREWLKRTGALAAGAGLGSLVGPGVQRAAWAQGQPKRGGILRVATVDKPVNMDPGYAPLYCSLQVYQNVYNKLVYVDEAGNFIPGLAKAWKQDGEKAWVFDLVDNATFHNGEPFTAKDVVFTFNRLLDAKNKLPMRVFFSPVEGVEALGPHQVRFNLSRSYGPFLAVLSQATEIVNEKAVGEKDPKLFPVGTGPFKFVEWVKDD